MSLTRRSEKTIVKLARLYSSYAFVEVHIDERRQVNNRGRRRGRLARAGALAATTWGRLCRRFVHLRHQLVVVVAALIGVRQYVIGFL